MGSLNPVLWIVVGGAAFAISAVSLALALPVGLAAFVYHNRKSGRRQALKKSAVIALLAWMAINILLCVLSLVLAPDGPVAL